MITNYLWRHRETQQVVRYLAIATEKTDENPDHWYNGIIYCPVDNPHNTYFCHEDVFRSRFDFLLDHEILALGLELN